MLDKIKKLPNTSKLVDCYDELIHIFISISYKSSLAYFLSILIYIWFLYEFIPHFILLIWSLVQVFYIIIRLYFTKKYKNIIFTPEIKIRFQHQHIFLVFIGGVTWGIGSLLCAIYAPTPYEYIVLTLIIGLASGSLSTLSPIYKVYLAFNIPALILLAISFSLYGDSQHYALVFMIFVFMSLVPSSTWDIHKNLKRSVELNNLYAHSQEQLKDINSSLEYMVKEEVDKNRKKDKQLLEQSRLAQMGEMLSMIAHQWRQPLSAITVTSGSISLHMQLENFNEEYVEKNLQKINTYAQYLSTTINDFRDFFKPNKEKNVTTLNDIVIGSLKIIGSSLEAQGIFIETSLDSKKEFFSYSNEIRQVLLDILKNAKDALSENKIKNPLIMIKTFNIDNHVTLSICDNGGGIDESIINYIFDPYFTTKEKRDGTGLGLYMSKMIIEDHCNGKLDVKNSDEGVCFCITLPIDK